MPTSDPVTYVGNYARSIVLEDEKGSPVQKSYFSSRSFFKKVWDELSEEKDNVKTFMGVRKNRLLD